MEYALLVHLLVLEAKLPVSRPAFPLEDFSCMVAVVAPSCQHHFHEGSLFRLVADTLPDRVGSPEQNLEGGGAGIWHD